LPFEGAETSLAPEAALDGKKVYNIINTINESTKDESNYKQKAEIVAYMNKLSRHNFFITGH